MYGLLSYATVPIEAELQARGDESETALRKVIEKVASIPKKAWLNRPILRNSVLVEGRCMVLLAFYNYVTSYWNDNSTELYVLAKK